MTVIYKPILLCHSTAGWILLKKTITFHCSMIWQQPAPIPKVRSLIIGALLVFLRSHTHTHTQCYVRSDETGTESAAEKTGAGYQVTN